MVPMPDVKDAERANMESIPTELVMQLVLYLAPKELARFSETCRHVYAICRDPVVLKSAIERRFGKEAVPQDHDTVDLYKILQQLDLKSLILTVDDMNITWIEDERYWRKVDDPSSIAAKFGKPVGQLRMVCWLNASGTIKGVPKGSYHVLWRLKTNRSGRDLGGTAISAWVSSVPEEDVIKMGQVLETNALQSALDWTYFEIGPLTVAETFGEITVELKNFEGHWKQGLFIDCVRLVSTAGERHGDREVDVESKAAPNAMARGGSPSCHIM
ncbi:hypothetical protein SeMB42_g03176 [Synchytrium endobioticum]|uniref:F-box domain-containing protein n=1 Tax=Synchytrium endobioticum TaxID=286115 RepID=A0A507D115_9FUNG|nr:hypothetical protein SeLEV6574_g04113 [Synchytrium endobioticum]TPX47834.1 hypothetical protein SeMB42_g03176 [Synchytrium endobioticum]